eukprot:gene1319-11402_t
MSTKIEEWNEKKNGKFSEHTLKRSLEKLGLKVETVTHNLDEKRKRKFEKITKIGISEGGKYIIQIDGEEFTVKPGQVITIPPNKEFTGMAATKIVIALEASK